MASGTPVIAIGRGAAPELVTDGTTGFLVDDVEEMARAVSRVAELDPSACAAATRARFSPEMMASSYRRIYDRVLWKAEAPQKRAGILENSAA